jgi:hypothetical protein
MDLIIDEPEEINTGQKLYPKDIINHTVLVWATDYIGHSPTQFNDGSDPKKPCDVVVVDLIDLDQVGEDGSPGLVSRGSWWRQGRLIQRLKPRVGRPNPLIGRIIKGLGPNGAFELMDLSADERALQRARSWWTINGGFIPSQPFDAPGRPQAPVQVSSQSVPAPPPSALEQLANQSLGRNPTVESVTMERLRRLAADGPSTEGDAPF